EELAVQMDLAVSLLRERRFEEAIEPLLKAIARDDENRPPWILLGEAYLRVDRPYKAAVAYLRSLELSPKDEQAWLGLGRVLRFIDELPTAAAVREGPRTVPPAPVPEAPRPPRVPTFVEGLDDSLEGGIPWGHLVLIEGAPGTMKSSLAFSILLHNAVREGLHCLYVSLEERASSLLKQMGSLGLKLDVP